MPDSWLEPWLEDVYSSIVNQHQGVDIVDAMAQAEDPANKAIVGHVKGRSYRFMLFATAQNAQWAADRLVKEQGYPLASLTFPANRNAFRLQPGDCFKYSSIQYNITDMVFRVVSIVEENLEKETVKVYAIEDVEYMSGAGTFDTIVVGNGPVGGKDLLSNLIDIAIFEAPYILSGNEIMIIPIAGQVVGIENGFHLYGSIDGSTYSLLESVPSYATVGTLAAEYTDQTLTLDDTVGFRVALPNIRDLETISRVELFSSTHLTIIGSDQETAEMITWQTITPVSSGIYDITGVYRARFGTDKRYHYIGEKVWFIGNGYTVIENDELTYGSIRYFKFVPYSGTVTLSLSEANPVSIQLVGMARRPYDPANFACNDLTINATYTENCVLTWSPRVRGDGAGLQNPDYIVSSSVVWEGLFEVQVCIGDTVIRTATGIDALTWTYTSSMNGSDNDELAETLTFKVRNYLVYDTVEYTSALVSLTVTKEEEAP